MENGDTSSSESEQMRYGMLGGDLLNTGEKLEKYTGAVGWSDLLPHFKSKALLYVDPTLAIADVGAALATDDKAKVERWIASGDLVRPGEAHADFWASSGAEFTAVVVSPFVLIQPADDNG